MTTTRRRWSREDVLALYRQYEAGAALDAVASGAGLTRQRIHQLFASEGLETRSQAEATRAYFAKERALADAAFTPERAEELRELALGGFSNADIAWALGMTRREVSRRLAEVLGEVERRGRIGMRMNHEKYSDDDISAALRRVAAAVGGTPGKVTYELHRQRGEPSAHTIAKRHGWGNAVAAAGLEPNPRPKGLDRNKYDDDACDKALRRVAEAIGHVPTYAEYRANRREGEPSAGTVRDRRNASGWIAALRRAGLS